MLLHNQWEGEAVIKCKYCKAEKPESEMSIWAGKPSKVCVECKKDHPNGGSVSHGNGGGGNTSKKRPAAARRARAAAPLELSIPKGGFGVTGRITEEGFLQLSQENDDAPADNICLTRHEAKALFDKFGEWIVEAA